MEYYYVYKRNILRDVYLVDGNNYKMISRYIYNIY